MERTPMDICKQIVNDYQNLPRKRSIKGTDFIKRFAPTMYTPVRILKNGEATVVFWVDGTKTVVKPADGIAPNDYEAFTAALAKKIFGNNSALKKVMQRKTVIQEPKRKKKKVEPECVFSGTTDETLPCESCHGTPSYSCPAARFPGDEGMEEPNEADRD